MDLISEPSVLQLYKKSFILELLQTKIQEFYYNSQNQHKLSLLSLHPSNLARQIEEDLIIIDELIIGIERNVGCGNLKRALHFLWILQDLIIQSQEQLNKLDYLELVG
ncbi:hypothetical protein [Paenibacillus sp. FSL R5-0912]|uniref:hypothetical protein n=1 Tax=Paenibacillus sp. FSL R5-0912 TaxID=1536771 RepID=UPI0004F5929C|nr:hypothetical protein [Paenibacillus sp. FSL R5-0912]AIQ39927.1 hypothetical protein R50912_07720 [Paenibacillus sp. FSL R5-0912]